MGRGRTFIERNLARFTRLLEDSIFAEETAQKKGWMQQMDPRIKVAATLLLLLGSSFSRSIPIILLIYSVSLILAAGSKVFSFSFLKRIWIFMPLYTAFVALPALFLTPGDVLIPLPGPDITQQGFTAATFLVLRVATSVSWMMLLVLTTSWPALLKSLRALGFPRTLVLLLLMTYRYIHVLLHTANSLFLARQSRRSHGGLAP
jgi:cobalt/nickel transport system permease protein